MRLLVEQGAPPGTPLPHQEGSAVLHLAAEVGDLEMVKWLLARKADLKSLDVRPWTPLTRAVEAGQIDVAKFGGDFIRLLLPYLLCFLAVYLEPPT